MEESKVKTLKDLLETPNSFLAPIHYYNQLYLKGFYMTVHAHMYVEIMYCTKNSFVFEYHTKDQCQLINIPKGSFVLINPGTYHRISIEDDVCRIMNIELQSCLEKESLSLSTPISEILSLSRSLQSIFSADEPFYVFTDFDLYVKNDIEQLVQELSKNNPAEDTEFLIRLLLQKTLLDISRCTQNINLGRNYMVYLRKALYCIQKNPCNVTVEGLARECGISKAYLQRLFKKELGESIVSITTKVRLHNAKKLLSNTSMSIDKIALACGYKDRRHLLTLFKKHENCSPSEYRRRSEYHEIPTTFFGQHEQFILGNPIALQISSEKKKN